MSIYSLGDLRRYPVANLIESLGVLGYELWANVNALEYTVVQRPAGPKSIGHSHVFAKRAQSLAYPRAVLAKLCEKAGRRLRQHGLAAYGIYLHYGLPDWLRVKYGRGGGGGGARLFVPLIDTRDIFRACWRLMIDDLPPGALPNFLAMGLFYLKPRVDQLELWPRGKHDSPALAKALDHLNDKYGDFTVSRGNFWGLDERDAPDRIGFRKSVSWEAQEAVVVNDGW